MTNHKQEPRRTLDMIMIDRQTGEKIKFYSRPKPKRKVVNFVKRLFRLGENA